MGDRRPSRYIVEGQIFSKVLEESGHLEAIAKAFPVPDNMRFTRAFGKAFFRCGRCRHEWTSRNTLVTFDIRDEVIVKVWRQACSRCVERSSEDVDSRDFYTSPVGFGVDDLIDLSHCAIKNFLYKLGYVKQRQRGIWDSSHRQELCEACADRCCPAKRQL